MDGMPSFQGGRQKTIPVFLAHAPSYANPETPGEEGLQEIKTD
jgi:hypothetical protein